MSITRQQMVVLGSLLLVGYLVFCGFGYIIGRETMSVQTPILAHPTCVEKGIPTVTSKPTAEGSEVDVVEWTWYRSQTGRYIYVDGIVKNVSNRPVRYVELHIELEDGSRRLLATDSGYIDIDILTPGQEFTFKLMTVNRPGTEWVVIKSVSWQWAD